MIQQFYCIFSWCCGCVTLEKRARHGCHSQVTVFRLKLEKLTHAKNRAALKTGTHTKWHVGKCYHSNSYRNDFKMGFAALVTQWKSYRHDLVLELFSLFPFRQNSVSFLDNWDTLSGIESIISRNNGFGKRASFDSQPWERINMVMVNLLYLPFLSLVLTSAPWSRRYLQTSVWPFCTASSRGMFPS